MMRAALAGLRLPLPWWGGRVAPEPGTVRLGHRRIYILPTRLGGLYVATIGILLVGSINYALQLGFALTFLLAGMGLAAMVHTTRNLSGLAFSAGRVDPVFGGEAAQFRVHAENATAYGRPAVMLRHSASGSQVVLDVPAGAIADTLLAVPAPRRGWLPLGRVLVETRFPLGLFRAWSYVHPDVRCLVYPRPEYAPLPPPDAASDAGAARASNLGSEDFSGLRAYQLQDSPRHVAWKAVARADDMLTKQFSGAIGSELWLDWDALPGVLDVEQRLSRLAGWVLEAERSGARYGLRLPQRELAPDRGDAHRAACLQALALHGTA